MNMTLILLSNQCNANVTLSLKATNTLCPHVGRRVNSVDPRFTLSCSCLLHFTYAAPLSTSPHYPIKAESTVKQMTCSHIALGGIWPYIWINEQTLLSLHHDHKHVHLICVYVQGSAAVTRLPQKQLYCSLQIICNQIFLFIPYTKVQLTLITSSYPVDNDCVI